jgi:hypothetical protein
MNKLKKKEDDRDNDNNVTGVGSTLSSTNETYKQEQDETRRTWQGQ